MCSITSPVFIINQKNANFHGLIDETEYVDACTGRRRSLLQGCDGGLGCSTRETQTSDCRQNHRAMPVTNIQALQLCAKKFYKLQRWWEVRGEEVIIPPPQQEQQMPSIFMSFCMSPKQKISEGCTYHSAPEWLGRGLRASSYTLDWTYGTNGCENGWVSPTMGSLEWEVVTLSFNLGLSRNLQCESTLCIDYSQDIFHKSPICINVCLIYKEM